MFRNYSNYEVFEDGRIYSYKKKRFLKPSTLKNGYQVVLLYDNEGKRKLYYLHRVVFEAVTGSPIPEGMQINHRSEVKTENMVTNLELVSPKQNCNFGTRNSRIANNTNRSKAISKALKGIIPKANPPKQVGAFNNNGELVMTFTSTNEAGRQGFNQGSVSSCCNGKRKTHKGFSWKYI